MPWKQFRQLPRLVPAWTAKFTPPLSQLSHIRVTVQYMNRIHATLQLSGAVNTLHLTIVIVPRRLNCLSIGSTTIVHVTNFVIFLQKIRYFTRTFCCSIIQLIVLIKLNDSYCIITLFYNIRIPSLLHIIILMYNFHFQFFN